MPKRPSGAPLHTLSKVYDVPVGFVTPPLILGSVLLCLRSPKGGCCSISDGLSSSCNYMYFVSVTAGDHKSPGTHITQFYDRLRLISSTLRASNFSLLVFKIDLNFNFVGFFTPSILASTCFARLNLYASDFNLLLYFVCLSITDKGSVTEMCIWPILVSQSDFTMVFPSQHKSFFYFNGLVSVDFWWTIGIAHREHMKPKFYEWVWL